MVDPCPPVGHRMVLDASPYRVVEVVGQQYRAGYGGRCCRAARRRRPSVSRPEQRYPCPYPTPSCAPGVLRRRARTPPSTPRCALTEAQRPRARLGKMKQNEASDAGLLTGSENPLHSLKVECCVDHVLLPRTQGLYPPTRVAEPPSCGGCGRADAPHAPATMETPSWFFSDSSCNTVESQRAQQRLAERLAELQQMCAAHPYPAHPARTTRLLACPAGSPTCPSGRSARRWATAAISTRWPAGCSPAALPPRRRPHSP
jgi:hypothetical protein